MEQAYQEAVTILSNNREGLAQLANKLIEKEVIFSEDLEHIFGKRPWDKEETPEVKTNEEPKLEDHEG